MTPGIPSANRLLAIIGLGIGAAAFVVSMLTTSFDDPWRSALSAGIAGIWAACLANIALLWLDRRRCRRNTHRD
ncbi:hypothetical protein GIS00_12040 [Nakamurella sp. YIM 132087]|uniref:DUF2530 domain-containing protein n=1 Tax=Nakamurella alba TaxID=2665158 RepID=A0A7K1FN72_9ACTN|nr:hypothetical protein [Nakamurella alba]MTD14673.1 hypothetical protein [Nakamurella alba]